MVKSAICMYATGNYTAYIDLKCELVSFVTAPIHKKYLEN